MTFRPDTSFPFLAVARRHGAAYEHVLMLASLVEGSLFVAEGPLASDVVAAVLAEAARRRVVELDAEYPAKVQR